MDQLQNDLRFDKIKGQKIAIMCANDLEFNIVCLICGFDMIDYKRDVGFNCISLGVTYIDAKYPAIGSTEMFLTNKFTLFTAVEFIKHNIGSIDPAIVSLDKIIESLQGAITVIDKQDMEDMQWNSVDGWVKSAYREAIMIKSQDELKQHTNGLIYIGLVFKSKYFQSPAEVVAVDIRANTLDVKVGNNLEKGWNLDHTIRGFDRGDYYIGELPEIKPQPIISLSNYQMATMEGKKIDLHLPQHDNIFNTLPVIFTTEDGYEYKGEYVQLFYIKPNTFKPIGIYGPNWWCQELPPNISPDKANLPIKTQNKWFYSEEAANEYAINKFPCMCLSDLVDIKTEFACFGDTLIQKAREFVTLAAINARIIPQKFDNL